MLRSSLLLFLLLPLSSLASILDFTSLSQYLPKGSQIAVTVIDSKTGKIDAKINENILLPPASTQKLITALATSLYLPKAFSFETKLYIANNDIIIGFGGDPTLKRIELKKLLAKLKQNKINAINGDIWLDSSIFTGYDKAVGLPWDTLGVCYTAPASAITLEENCFHGTLYANKNKSTRIYVPQHQPVSVTTLAKAMTENEQKKQYCDLDLQSDQNNNYQLSGCMTYIDKPLPLQFAINNPAKYTADVIRQLLKELDISFKGQIRFDQPLPSFLTSDQKLIATHSSAKRDALLVEVLKESNNLVSDNLLKFIGHQYYQTQGSFRNGVSAVKEIIKQNTQIDLSQTQMVDGSGLSRDNRMTVATLSKILLWIYQNPQQGLIKLMPTAGVDGTIKYRHGIRYSPIKNNLIAKSGSLYGTHNLAGILRRKDKDLLVVQFVANYFVSEQQKKLDKENRNNMAIAKFEKALYETLLKVPNI